MKPLRLVMTAFGPYAQQEIIDFTKLNNKNLFLITGPTGSGKTTIFDAICYAIYGECSGSIRTTDSLKSQFAPPEVLTQVELEFELHSIKYLVSRTPKQLKPKTRGRGFTEQAAAATLKITDGDEVNTIAGSAKVTAKLLNIIGINAEQFRQIMMIPQGEFRKLLIADSRDRQKVLQKLFDTNIYSRVQEKLEHESKQIYNSIKDKTMLRTAAAKSIEFEANDIMAELLQTPEKITEIIAATEAVIATDLAKAQAVDVRIKQKNNLLRQQLEQKKDAEESNKKLAGRQQLQNELIQLQSQEKYYRKLEESLVKAERVQRVLPLESNLKQRRAQLNRQQTELAELIERTSAAEHRLEQAKANYEQQTSDQARNYRQQVYAQLLRLQNLEQRMKKIDELKQATAQANNSLTLLKKKRQQVEQEQAQLRATEKAIYKKIESSRAAGLKLAKQKYEIANRQSLLNTLQSAIKAYESWHGYLRQSLTQERKVISLIKALQTKANDLKQRRKNLLANQAAVLAQDLQAGQPCPVCGSTEHHKLAAFTSELPNLQEITEMEYSLEEQQRTVNSENEKLAKLSERAEQTGAEYHRLRSELTEKLNINPDMDEGQLIGHFRLLKQDYVDELNLVLQTKQELLRQAGLLSEYEQEHAKLGELISTAETTVAEINKKQLQALEQYTKLDSDLQTVYRELPSNIRSYQDLMLQIADQDKVYQQLQQQEKLVSQEQEQAARQLAGLQAKKQQLDKHITESREQITAAQEQLTDALIRLEVSTEQEYQQFKLEEAQIKLYKQQLTAYQQQLHTVQQQLAVLIEQTEDVDFIDIGVLERLIDNIDQELQQLHHQSSQIRSRLAANEKILRNIKHITAEINIQEKKYHTVGHLAKIANGKSSEAVKITFERYVLAAFLEDILEAANQHLRKMTSGRYLLSRSDEVDRKNKQSGLELQVYDNYTGYYRHVKTLSGGESFKASLSMALGLSDVIQSYVGGIKLDTMFVDEGFGTLDPESLDSAINCLIDLQKTGRLVGIISHVPELKERIEARLEVKASSSGSSTEFVVI